LGCGKAASVNLPPDRKSLICMCRSSIGKLARSMQSRPAWHTAAADRGEATVNPSVDQAAVWICSYLREHPKAADTAEGIQRWWLAPNYGEVALVTVEMALTRLEGEGVVMIAEPLALHPTYGLDPTHAPRS
jgi:hypothetical protein